jgi:bile acid:Na+ symporter, BASS family
MKLINLFVNLYPLWIVLASVIGILHPPAFLWFSGRWVESAIALVMLGMGFTLTPDDFRRLLKVPTSFGLGFACQYTVMPLLGWAIGRALNLEPGFAAGLILVSACPGGVASNLISYLARANVALSVVLTMASTLTAFVMTPLWCKTLAGAYVEVDALGICLSTLRAVVAPVLLGVFCNWRFPRIVARASIYGPLVSVISIIFIAGSIVAPNAEKVIANAGRLTLALTLLHGCGFVLGFWLTRLLRFHDDIARTVAIEVGMQNGGMAAMLAKKHFAADPLVGVPAVFCSVLQTLLGSLVAAYWRFRPLHSSHASHETPTSPTPNS